jgi:mandelate racemase
MSDLPTITSVTARAVNAPLERPVRTASGALESAPLLLIDIGTDAGVTGRAYVMGYTVASLEPMRAFAANIETMCVGQPIAPADRAADFEAAFRLMGRQGLVGMVLSGIDMALWDALGQAHSAPVVQLLGGSAVPVKAYDSYGIVDMPGDAAVLEGSVKRGFRAIKIKLGDGDVALDVETCRAVRDVIGDDVALMIDYNQSLTVTETLWRLDHLGEFDLFWVEEPVPAEDFDAHAEIRAATSVPVQTGENWWFVSDMEKALAAGACDFAMPDLMKIGGITGWQKAAGLAAAARIPMSSHLFIEASAHVLPVTATAHYLEYLDLAATVLQEPPELKDGRVAAVGPGLGMVWDEAAVKRYLL